MSIINKSFTPPSHLLQQVYQQEEKSSAGQNLLGFNQNSGSSFIRSSATAPFQNPCNEVADQQFLNNQNQGIRNNFNHRQCEYLDVQVQDNLYRINSPNCYQECPPSFMTYQQYEQTHIIPSNKNIINNNLVQPTGDLKLLYNHTEKKQPSILFSLIDKIWVYLPTQMIEYSDYNLKMMRKELDDFCNDLELALPEMIDIRVNYFENMIMDIRRDCDREFRVIDLLKQKNQLKDISINTQESLRRRLKDIAREMIDLQDPNNFKISHLPSLYYNPYRQSRGYAPFLRKSYSAQNLQQSNQILQSERQQLIRIPFNQQREDYGGIINQQNEWHQSNQAYPQEGKTDFKIHNQQIPNHKEVLEDQSRDFRIYSFPDSQKHVFPNYSAIQSTIPVLYYSEMINRPLNKSECMNQQKIYDKSISQEVGAHNINSSFQNKEEFNLNYEKMRLLSHDQANQPNIQENYQDFEQYQSDHSIGNRKSERHSEMVLNHQMKNSLDLKENFGPEKLQKNQACQTSFQFSLGSLNEMNQLNIHQKKRVNSSSFSEVDDQENQEHQRTPKIESISINSLEKQGRQQISGSKLVNSNQLERNSISRLSQSQQQQENDFHCPFFIKKISFSGSKEESQVNSRYSNENNSSGDVKNSNEILFEARVLVESQQHLEPEKHQQSIIDQKFSDQKSHQQTLSINTERDNQYISSKRKVTSETESINRYLSNSCINSNNKPEDLFSTNQNYHSVDHLEPTSHKIKPHEECSKDKKQIITSNFDQLIINYQSDSLREEKNCQTPSEQIQLDQLGNDSLLNQEPQEEYQIFEQKNKIKSIQQNQNISSDEEYYKDDSGIYNDDSIIISLHQGKSDRFLRNKERILNSNGITAQQKSSSIISQSDYSLYTEKESNYFPQLQSGLSNQCTCIINHQQNQSEKEEEDNPVISRCQIHGIESSSKSYNQEIIYPNVPLEKLLDTSAGESPDPQTFRSRCSFNASPFRISQGSRGSMSAIILNQGMKNGNMQTISEVNEQINTLGHSNSSLNYSSLVQGNPAQSIKNSEQQLISSENNQYLTLGKGEACVFSNSSEFNQFFDVQIKIENIDHQIQNQESNSRGVQIFEDKGGQFAKCELIYDLQSNQLELRLNPDILLSAESAPTLIDHFHITQFIPFESKIEKYSDSNGVSVFLKIMRKNEPSTDCRVILFKEQIINVEKQKESQQENLENILAKINALYDSFDQPNQTTREKQLFNRQDILQEQVSVQRSYNSLSSNSQDFIPTNLSILNQIQKNQIQILSEPTQQFDHSEFKNEVYSEDILLKKQVQAQFSSSNDKLCEENKDSDLDSPILEGGTQQISNHQNSFMQNNGIESNDSQKYYEQEQNKQFWGSEQLSKSKNLMKKISLDYQEVIFKNNDSFQHHPAENKSQMISQSHQNGDQNTLNLTRLFDSAARSDYSNLPSSIKKQINTGVESIQRDSRQINEFTNLFRFSQKSLTGLEDPQLSLQMNSKTQPIMNFRQSKLAPLRLFHDLKLRINIKKFDQDPSQQVSQVHQQNRYKLNLLMTTRTEVENGIIQSFSKFNQKQFLMLKYGYNTSTPQQRHIFFSSDFRFLCWKSPTSPDIKRMFPIDSLRNFIYHGRTSDNFKRFHAKSQNSINLSFSLVLGERTIDLEAYSSEDKSSFLEGLVLIFRAFQ